MFPEVGLLEETEADAHGGETMPKLSESLCEAINAQIQNEIASAYLYLDMSAQCATRTLKGTAHWLRRQWEEELGHATKMMDYLIERGNEVRLKAIPKPEFRFQSLTAAFEQVLDHEQKVTTAIHDLFTLAAGEKDYAAQAFLQWYVNEQVEEENSARDVVDMLRIGGDQGAALLMVDRRLGERR